jgi:hypothetical protein
MSLKSRNRTERPNLRADNLYLRVTRYWYEPGAGRLGRRKPRRWRSDLKPIRLA